MSEHQVFPETAQSVSDLGTSAKDNRSLRALVLVEGEETSFVVDPKGGVSAHFVLTWEQLKHQLLNGDYDVVALELGKDRQHLDNGDIDALQRIQPDIHIAIFGPHIPVMVARDALRSGVTGVCLNTHADECMDTALCLVASGNVYLSSALAEQLIAESDPLADAEQAVISLGDTVAIIADDDEFFRMATVAILRDHCGFGRVLEASNLDQARQLIEAHSRVDLALFDLDMPGMRGASSLQDLRMAHPEVRKMAVVSSSRDRSDVLEALAAGTYGYVAKSEGISEMKHAFKQIQSGRVYAPALLHESPEEAEQITKVQRPIVSDPEPVRLETAPEMVAAASRYIPEPDLEQDTQASQDIPELSPRQRKVLELLVQGMSNKEIARTLDLGIGTVKVHMTALFSKLGVSNRTSAVAVGARLL